MQQVLSERRSAATYLRHNVLVGVNLDDAIPVSGKLPSPNGGVQRSAITPYGKSNNPSGHHIEINLDVRELAKLAWPSRIPTSTDSQLLCLGQSLAFFLREGTRSVRGALGMAHTCLHDAGIKVHGFPGQPVRGDSDRRAVPYITFEFAIPARVRDAEERVLQLPHPIRRLNYVIDILRNHGFRMAYCHADILHIEQHGERFFPQGKCPEIDQEQQLPPFELRKYGVLLDAPRDYLRAISALAIPPSARCPDGKARFERTADYAIFRLDLKDVPTLKAAQALHERVRSFLQNRHSMMLEAFMLPETSLSISADSTRSANSPDTDLGSIDVSLRRTQQRPFRGYLDFLLTYPKNLPEGESKAIRERKLGLLLEQFSSVLFEYHFALTRSYESE